MIIPGLGIFSTVENPDCGIITTLDLKIQKKAEQVLKDSDGTAPSSFWTQGQENWRAPALRPMILPAWKNIWTATMKSSSTRLPRAFTRRLNFQNHRSRGGSGIGRCKRDMFFLQDYEEINGIRINCSKEEGYGSSALAIPFQNPAIPPLYKSGS